MLTSRHTRGKNQADPGKARLNAMGVMTAAIPPSIRHVRRRALNGPNREPTGQVLKGGVRALSKHLRASTPVVRKGGGRDHALVGKTQPGTKPVDQ